jgi:hypothetical protein
MLEGHCGIEPDASFLEGRGDLGRRAGTVKGVKA